VTLVLRDRYGGPMSAHRGVLAAVALLLLAAVPACGFADDNYDNAQAALDRSKPDLTVPETVTTMAPYQTIPGDDTSGSIPVELATPAQRAAALAEAQQRADDRKAGRVSGSVTAGGGALGTAPTTTTVPTSAACNSSRKLQEVGTLLLMSPKVALPAYRESLSALARTWQDVLTVLPPANRPLAEPVVAAFLDVEAKSVTATSVDEVVKNLTFFLRSQSKQITKVLTVLTSLCPEVIDSGQDQAESVPFG
jgi:hypothetical protein